MAVDLHLHSTESDGTLEPAELVQLAAKSNIRAIAITDHDSIDGVRAALDAGERLGVEVVPGVELSSDLDGRDIHFLGYFIDYEDRELHEHLRELRESRYRRAAEMVERLRKAGLDIVFSDVLEEAGPGSLGRTHVARVLLKRGLIDNIEQAFQRYIGRRAPFYVEKYAFTPADVIGMIKDVGGIAVLSHPGLSGVDGMVPKLVEHGLDGIEVYHGEHSSERVSYYERMAEAHGLITTGGSDFHGYSIGGMTVGATSAPDEVMDDLRRLKDAIKAGIDDDR